MAVTCRDCDAASANRLHGVFDWHCTRCRARFLCRRPEYAESKRAGRMSRNYLDLLRKWNVEHEDVKAEES